MEVREEQERERIERKLGAMDREVQRLIDAYQAGVIELGELRERRSRIEEHGQTLRERLTEIGRQMADREQEVRLLTGLDEFCESVCGALVEPSFETKQKVLRLVIDRIVVEDSKITIRHVVPTGPVRLQTKQHAIPRRTTSLRLWRQPSADNHSSSHLLHSYLYAMFRTYWLG